MVRDDKPMLPIRQNTADLGARWGHVPAYEPGGPKPWHVALLVWWHFLARRDAALGKVRP